MKDTVKTFERAPGCQADPTLEDDCTWPSCGCDLARDANRTAEPGKDAGNTKGKDA